MHQEGILGVLGGMGPQATNTFYQRIIDRTQAESDQEHLRVLIKMAACWDQCSVSGSHAPSSFDHCDYRSIAERMEGLCSCSDR